MEIDVTRENSCCSCRDDQGKFPDYPSDDEGGSASIFHPERLRAAAAAAAANGANRAAAAAAAQDEDSDDGRKDGGGGEQDKAKAKPKKTMEEKSGGGGDKKGKEAEDEEESGFTLRSSDFVKQLRRGQKTFEGEIADGKNKILKFINFPFRHLKKFKRKNYQRYGSSRRGSTWRAWSSAPAPTCRTSTTDASPRLVKTKEM